MKTKLLYALVSSSVITGSSFGITTVVMDHLPSGRVQQAAEKYAVTPGKILLERLEDEKSVKKLRKQGSRAIKEGKKKMEKALAKYYNVGIWAVVGFVVSFLLTLLLGISSVKTALALGLKVTLVMFFLQVSLVFAGILFVTSSIL